MITLSIEKFADSEDDFVYNTTYDDRKLYVVRNENKILYIGVSEKCIWSRWFSQRASHMVFSYDLSLVGRSNIGIAVQEAFPKSSSWNIDLWLEEEILDFLEIEHTWNEKAERYWVLDPTMNYNRFCDIKYLESILIRYLVPRYNIMGNNWKEPNEYFLTKYLNTFGEER